MDNTIGFSSRSVTTTGQTTPRAKALSVAIGDQIYYFGGQTEVKIDKSCAVIHIFNTKSNTWTRIDTKPPKEECSILNGVAVNSNIWILSGLHWVCFDTVKGEWLDVALQLESRSYNSATYHSFAVLNDVILYYDGPRDLEEKSVVCLDTQAKSLHAQLAAYGDIPHERAYVTAIAIAENLVFMYLPYDTWSDDRAARLGELFYYDTKHVKWARVDQKNRPKKDLQYIGLSGHHLVFLQRTYEGMQNVAWTLDLRTHEWTTHPLNGSENQKTFIRCATLVNNQIYCWMNDGQLIVVDISGVNDEQGQQILQQVVAKARELLAAIKPPVVVIDEFSTEPIVLDTELDAVDANQLTVHEEISSNFKALFPLIDPEKIISSTVPEPSDTIRTHKNYIHYLTLAWSNHFSVVLSPDIIFFTILCEIADEILSDPDSYRHLFTDSQEKKQIMTLTHDVEHIDVTQIIEGISKNMPVDSSIFTANFSSSTTESQLAIQSAFCEAMSAYYFTYSSLCGIPRVKVLGTKEDWQTIEQKVHRMRTEVFSQDATMTKKLCAYLKKVEAQVRKIYTKRDPAFWKEMFSIDNCVSGHTDVVNGWIALFYREHEVNTMDGRVIYSGNDFYNYKAHIATVKWQNIETRRFFELKSGLVSSRIVSGSNELDAKYPWLEPSFSHVIVETDGLDKMSPEQFKTYIKETLKGQDKYLMKEFYDLLKDEPIELVKGGDKELTFRYELAGREIDAWKEDFVKTGQGLTTLDLTIGRCGAAFHVYREFKENVHRPAADVLVNKIRDYVALNKGIKCVNLSHMRGAVIPLEGGIIKLLIGYPALEELRIGGLFADAYDQLAQLLLHPDCKLKVLRIDSESYVSANKTEAEPNDDFATALLKKTAPLESLFISKITSVTLASAIGELCTRPNGLKVFGLGDKTSNAEARLILLRAVATSRTLEEIGLFTVGSRLVIEDNKRTYVKLMTDEVTSFIVENVPRNPSLKTLNYVNLELTPEQQAKILSIPTLQTIARLRATDLSFLKVTKQLQHLKMWLKDSPEQVEVLREFLADELCPLKELDVSHNDFKNPEVMAILARGLAKNRSIEKINFEKLQFKKNDEVEKELQELMTQWLESNDCQLVDVNFQYVYTLSFDVDHTRRILKALVNNKKMKKIRASFKVDVEDYSLLVDLFSKNSTLAVITSISKVYHDEEDNYPEFTDEQILALRARIEASPTVQCADLGFLLTSAEIEEANSIPAEYFIR